MCSVRVHGFALSLDGYGAGPNQSLANPLGVGGTALHEWTFATRTFQRMYGQDGGASGIDDGLADGFGGSERADILLPSALEGGAGLVGLVER